jgi:hypothetical protein
MNVTDPVAGGIIRLGRRVAAVIAECNEAQRRLTYFRLSYDRYMLEGDRAPDTYAEFLVRTSGPLHREPSARQRDAGRGIR